MPIVTSARRIEPISEWLWPDIALQTVSVYICTMHHCHISGMLCKSLQGVYLYRWTHRADEVDQKRAGG